jgi:protein gp37
VGAKQGVEGISWTDTTWNPVRGCSRVSPGCDHCYAMGQAHRFSGAGGAYEGLTTIRRGKVDWSGVARFVPKELDKPLRWRKPQRIFVNSMSDLFHHSLTNEEIAAVFGVMAAAPRHTFQILTKRPERMVEWFKWVNSEPTGLRHRRRWPNFTCADNASTALLRSTWMGGPLQVNGSEQWPLPHVWLGVSVENQATADERIPLLLKCPAAVRFISAEPLLGPIDLTDIVTRVSPGVEHHRDALYCDVDAEDDKDWHGATLGWVIAGGESGPGARPCALEWLESVVAQCRAARVPCFVKQLGSYVVSEQRACDTDEDAKREFGFGSRWLWRAGTQDRKGGDPSEWPPELRVREFPEVRT